MESRPRMWADRERGAVPLVGPRSAVRRPSVVAKIQPANKSTLRNTMPVAQQVAKPRTFPCAARHDSSPRAPGRECVVTRSLPASISRNTKLSGGAKPSLGSETRVAPRETAQTCNIRYQGGYGYHSYASIPRGLRCEPWSGRAKDIGMNGDNQLDLGVICRQSVEEADGLGCM